MVTELANGRSRIWTEVVPEPTYLHTQPCCLKLEWALCPLLIRVVSYISPIPAWGFPSWVTKGFGSMINSPEKLEVSSWSSIHSDHHCPQDPFKIRKLICPSLHAKGKPGGLWLRLQRDWAVPIPWESYLASSTSPLGSPLSGLRCLNQSLGRDLLWRLMASVSDSWPRKTAWTTKTWLRYLD